MTSKLFPVPRFKILTFNFPTNAIQACTSQHLNEAEKIGCLGLLPLFKIISLIMKEILQEIWI